MNKNSYLNINGNFSPEQNLKELSSFQDEDGIDSKAFGFSRKYVKKISMIDGWVKNKDNDLDQPHQAKSNLQTHRKLIKPNIGTVKSHYSHFAFTPRPINNNQPHIENLIFHHVKRPMSSTIVRHDHFDQSITPIQSNRQKTHHQYLRKNSGVKTSRKSLEKEIKKKTIQSSIYPIFETNSFQNPQKLMPNIGRISYLVKMKKRNSMDCNI